MRHFWFQSQFLRSNANKIFLKTIILLKNQIRRTKIKTTFSIELISKKGEMVKFWLPKLSYKIFQKDISFCLSACKNIFYSTTAFMLLKMVVKFQNHVYISLTCSRRGERETIYGRTHGVEIRSFAWASCQGSTEICVSKLLVSFSLLIFLSSL